MDRIVDEREAVEQFSELVERTLARGERFLIHREGAPVAALVPAAYLKQVSGAIPEPGGSGAGPNEAALWEAALRSMEERGMITRPKTGQVLPFDQRPLIEVRGKPLSETIVEERGRW